MKLLSSHFTAPVVFVVLSFAAGCSSDNAPAGSGGATAAGGSSSGGKAGSSGGSVSVGGTSAGGTAPAAGGMNTGGSAPGTGGGSTGATASFADVKAIITKSCFGNGCHGQEGNPLQMGMESSLYTTLTTHVTKNCGMLVNKASPADSALVKILQKSCGTAPNITDRMPLGMCADGETPEESAGCVPTADVAKIQAWIASGAPQQ